MDIVKAFNSNELHTNIVIKGDYNNPIFRASDIGEILEMGNIRTSIINFDESEKVVHTMDTLGGLQQVTFLTEKGLYKVLFKSRKPIAETFQMEQNYLNR
jgi:prophage antirepressor-like protein